MAIHRLPLWLNKHVTFFKLLGCGKNGNFSKTPDWQLWGTLIVIDENHLCNYTNKKSLLQKSYGSFIANWWQIFACQTQCFLLKSIEGHGYWNGKQPFGHFSTKTNHDGPIAVITRASINNSKVARFWDHVDAVSMEMQKADGFRFSVGLGENPWNKQATFSIWQSKEHMKQFAYKMPHHKTVIQKTRQENWYSEDLFVRFKIIATL